MEVLLEIEEFRRAVTISEAADLIENVSDEVKKLYNLPKVSIALAGVDAKDSSFFIATSVVKKMEQFY